MYGKRELISVYVDPEMFMKIENRRGEKSRSKYIVDILKKKHEENRVC